MEEKGFWARLRWPIKAFIIAAPIIGLGYWGYESGKIQTISDNLNTKQDTTILTNTSKPTKADNNQRSFNYVPEKPVNGEYKGVIEVGASGFNSFVVNIDKEKRWEIISKDFGKSFVYEGMATTADIRNGLKDYIGAMFDKGVKSKNIHFVISSGAQKEPKTAIITSELKKMGYIVNLVTAEQEGKLALKCVLPTAYYDNSFVVDIGSGNTKISWIEDDVKSAEAPGAKYYEKDLKDENVYTVVKKLAEKIPAKKTEICFIIGGVPFELAKQVRNGEERFTVLNDPDKYNTDKIKIKSGVNIYKAIKDATNCDTFVFDWDANFTIGFLLSIK